jgi:hypothetical protein
MPIYTFKNPETDEVVEVLQKMAEDHSYTDEEGSQWERVWYPTNFSIDGTINPWSKDSFNKSAEGKNYTLGEMWDRSAEMSAIRAEKEGADPVKEKWEKDYAKNRKGMKYSKDGSLLGDTSGLDVEIT